MRRVIASLAGVTMLLMVSGCGGIPGVPKIPGGDLDPSACGSYASSDIGGKLKSFFSAIIELKNAVEKTEGEIKAACALMAAEIGSPTEGKSASVVCEGVANALQEHIQVGLKVGARLEVDYKEPYCEVKVDVAASAAMSCQASAKADVKVTCQGSCEGECEGECEGSNEGGSCGGQCNGTCNGTCQGYADVEAKAECQAQASIKANVAAECTKPEVKVGFKAEMVADTSKLEKAKAAVEAGMPGFLALAAYAKGPLKGAVQDTLGAAKDLKNSAADFKAALKDEFICVSGQLAAGLKAAKDLSSSVGVQVDISVSISASASAEGSAGG